jgi:hypothetical protein
MKSNSLVKESSKKKILEMHTSLIKSDQAKLDDRKKPERHKKIVTSVQVISALTKKFQMKSVNILGVIEEEREYQKKLKLLKYHGEFIGKEGQNSGNEYYGKESSSD